MSRETYTSTLPAMSTTVAVISVGVPEREHTRAMNVVTAEVELWQQLFSRFRPGSTISRINAAMGKWTEVEEIFMELLESARDAVMATRGRFNPAILPALEAHGYDRSFDQIQKARTATLEAPGMVSGMDEWTKVVIDRVTMRVRLPEHLRVDFGGIAKGALADRLADRFATWPGGTISIGGDMCLWGVPPDGDRWRVGIEHPLDADKDIVKVTHPAGARLAIATSSRTKRTWPTPTGHAHHLIDPFTGEPTTSPLLAVTVGAQSAIAAEVATKNLMVASTYEPMSRHLLVNAEWALVISDSLAITHISREAA